MLSRMVGVVRGRGAVGGGGVLLSITGDDITPPSCGQTDRCKNITLLQTSFAGGKNESYFSSNDSL